MKVKIKKLAIVQMGYSFRSRLETTTGGDVAVIQMKDLANDNTVDCNNLAKIELDSLKEHHLTQHNDLIFRSRGHTLTAAILLSDPGRAVVAAPLLRIRV
ncbi:MAG: restriction endonuclease subunit S, partial [Lentisphaerae bacterium]|nr:restriction endonuclease subunit S [Lentisphaerota bacterium]